MAIDFPNSPVDNDTYTFGDKTWIYADGKWTIAFTSTMTLASLNVTGDITVDTTTLKVNSSTDRVGIGTASPSTALQVVGTVTATAFAGPLTGNVTGNVSGTAATVTGAAQTAITSVGTLTALSVTGTVTAGTFSGSGASLTALPAANLSGATLASGVTGSSLTSVGTLTNLTVTNAINGTLIKTVTGTNTADLIYGNMADNDQFRIRIGGTATNAGFVEIATADDGTEPIHVRQYTGVFTTLTRTATLLDGSGNTSFPGTVTAPTFSGGLASSNLTGQTGMWTSANRPGPYRLYRRDYDDQYNVQTYWTGSRWRLYGYYNDSGHADTHVGYADSAGSASTAGSSNETYFTGTYLRMSGNGEADPHTQQGLQSGVGGAGAGVAMWATNVAPQFRVGANNPTVYLRNADDTGYQTLEGIITNVSSLHLKQDIETFPQILHSAGAAVNEDEIFTGLNIVRQLRPVTYRWKEKEHLSQLPENPRRALALSRLNTIRKSKELEPYDSDELHHDCSRDGCSGTAESPCQWTKNWEIGNIGFISQEVGAVIPQAAILGKNGDFTGLDSLAMTALAVAAIKELDAKVTSLMERIEALENK
jgi:hypothetical protein